MIHKCDWCKAPMHKIADRGSGLGADHYDLWLCNNITCGHEQEYLKPEAQESILKRSGFK